MKPGPRNLITDVAGLKVGNATNAVVKSGVTALVGDDPFIAGVHVMGGAPGTRETDLLAPDKLVQKVDALVLSGGSAFGLDAASGVADGLRSQGRGYQVGEARVPIVPSAILFDLLNGGDKSWKDNPYKAMGRMALDAAGESFKMGSEGCGTGATTANLKGGLGSASVVLDSGITVGAIVGVNAVGTAVADGGPRFWAGAWEMAEEFGGMGGPKVTDAGFEPSLEKLVGEATTIAIVATDAALDRPQAQRMAIAAHDGMARSLVPSHTPFDGDLVFSAATGRKAMKDPEWDILRIGHAAATCLARAIARGVYLARAAKGDDLPTWQDKFGK